MMDDAQSGDGSAQSTQVSNDLRNGAISDSSSDARRFSLGISEKAIDGASVLQKYPDPAEMERLAECSDESKKLHLKLEIQNMLEDGVGSKSGANVVIGTQSAGKTSVVTHLVGAVFLNVGSGVATKRNILVKKEVTASAQQVSVCMFRKHDKEEFQELSHDDIYQEMKKDSETLGEKFEIESNSDEWEVKLKTADASIGFPVLDTPGSKVCSGNGQETAELLKQNQKLALRKYVNGSCKRAAAVVCVEFSDLIKGFTQTQELDEDIQRASNSNNVFFVITKCDKWDPNECRDQLDGQDGIDFLRKKVCEFFKVYQDDPHIHIHLVALCKLTSDELQRYSLERRWTVFMDETEKSHQQMLSKFELTSETCPSCVGAENLKKAILAIHEEGLEETVGQVNLFQTTCSIRYAAILSHVNLTGLRRRCTLRQA